MTTTKSACKNPINLECITVRALLLLRLWDLLQRVVVDGLRECRPGGVVGVLGAGGEQGIAALGARIHAWKERTKGKLNKGCSS